MGSIPTWIDEITPAWLAEAIGLPVEGADLEQIGVGIGVSSAVYRGAAHRRRVPGHRRGQAARARRGGGLHLHVLRMYTREAGFFDELAGLGARAHPGVPPLVRRPRHEPVRARARGHRRAARRRPDRRGCAVADAERASTAWPRGTPPGGARRRPSPRPGSPSASATRSTRRCSRWCSARGGRSSTPRSTIPDAIRAVGPRWTAAMPRLLDGLAEEPTTMTHGDFRADNLFFEADGSVGGRSTSSSSAPAEAPTTWPTSSPRASEPSRRLGARAGAVRPWTRRPSRPRASTGGRPATAWDDYRKAALFCLVYPVVAWRGMDVGRSPPGRPGHHDARPLRPGRRRARPHRRSDSGRLADPRPLAYAGDPQPHLRYTPKGSSSTGRAAVSKTAGWGFESLLPCTSRPEEPSTSMAMNRQQKRMLQRQGQLGARRRARGPQAAPAPAAPRSRPRSAPTAARSSSARCGASCARWPGPPGRDHQLLDHRARRGGPPDRLRRRPRLRASATSS